MPLFLWWAGEGGHGPALAHAPGVQDILLPAMQVRDWRGDMGRHLYRKHPDEVSPDADVKDFFLYRPDRKAISKGGTGLPSTPDTLPEADGRLEYFSPHLT